MTAQVSLRFSIFESRSKRGSGRTRTAPPVQAFHVELCCLNGDESEGRYGASGSRKASGH